MQMVDNHFWESESGNRRVIVDAQHYEEKKSSVGKSVLGLSIMIPSPQIVEMAGKLGFDWVLIDCEHGSISLENGRIDDHGSGG